MSDLENKLNSILDEKIQKLIPGNIKSGITIFGVEGTLNIGVTPDETISNGEYGLENATSVEGDNDIGYKIFTAEKTSSKLYETGSIVEMHITNEMLAQALSITADKIKTGEVICGVEGTLQEGVDTSDATATADDIIDQKTAYVNGEKITGILQESSGTGFMDSAEGFFTYSFEGDYFKPKCHTNARILLAQNAEVEMYLPLNEVAQALGITADKIKAGETVCGIVGTYTGETT